jgi:ketosteroid isomerase-like protein
MMRAHALRHHHLSTAGHARKPDRLDQPVPSSHHRFMDHQQAQRFVESWADAWNAHDVDAVLDHFADDAVFSSPVAAQLLGDSDGVLRGKRAIRDYWRRGVDLIPDLHFEVVGVYLGLSTLVINYRNQKGGLVNEVLIFDGSLVVSGHGTYLGTDTNPAGATDG